MIGPSRGAINGTFVESEWQYIRDGFNIRINVIRNMNMNLKCLVRCLILSLTFVIFLK